MSSDLPDPEKISLLAKAAATLSGVAMTLFGLVFKGMNSRIEDVKISLAAATKEAKEELGTQRGHIEKLYEKQEEIREEMHNIERRSMDRHAELLNALRENNGHHST